MTVYLFICTGIGNTFSSGFKSVTNTFKGFGNSIGSGLSNVGNFLSK